MSAIGSFGLPDDLGAGLVGPASTDAPDASLVGLPATDPALNPATLQKVGLGIYPNDSNDPWAGQSLTGNAANPALTLDRFSSALWKVQDGRAMDNVTGLFVNPADGTLPAQDIGLSAVPASSPNNSLGDIHAVVQQQKDRLTELAVALPVDPLDTDVVERINSAKLHHQDPATINKILATVADFEHVTALPGTVEGTSFDLSSIPALRNAREMVSEVHDMPGAGATEVHEARISGPAAQAVAQFKAQAAAEASQSPAIA